MKNEYLLVAAVNSYTSHSEVGFLRRPSASGNWEGCLGKAKLSDVVLDETSLSFTSHTMGSVPIKITLSKAEENIYRKARFTSYATGSGSDRGFHWSGDRDNLTILLIPVLEGFTQRLLRDLPKPEEKPSDQNQVVDIPW